MKRAPLIRLYDDEGCIDGFAGGGGTSKGIEMALGRPPDVAINHDAEAIAMHEVNHPTTRHIQTNIRKVHFGGVLGGKYCGFAWFSPDCTYFSKARGKKPHRDRNRARRIRGLAWEAVRCAVEIRAATGRYPRVMFIENVEEFQDWCPLGDDGLPDESRRGLSFRQWVGRLRGLGAHVEWRELRACDFGAPTTRKRLFVIIRFDGQPIVWPKTTHGKMRPQPHAMAADCIDFSQPVPSIFLTKAQAKRWGKAHGVPAPKRPLAIATQRRIARGIQRFVLDAAEPFIVPVDSGVVAPFVTEHANASTQRNMPANEPLRTICAQVKGGHFALVAPTLINTRNGERLGQAPRVRDIREPFSTVTAQGSQGALVATFLTQYHKTKSDGGERGQSLAEPLRTLDTSNKFGLVAAFLAKHNGGHEATGQRLTKPCDAIVCKPNKALVTSHLMKLRGGLFDHVITAQDVREPIPALTAQGTHLAEVRAFLVKFYGSKKDGRPLLAPLDTVTTKERFGLVTVTIGGEEYAVVDIGMRMLTPRELFLCQGFPKGYHIDCDVRQPNGKVKRLTKKAQTRLVGNSVPPHVAAALIGANVTVNAEAVA